MYARGGSEWWLVVSGVCVSVLLILCLCLCRASLPCVRVFFFPCYSEPLVAPIVLA